MTLVYLTIDTEYEVGFTARRGRESRAENFDRSIRGATREGDVGIFYQMDRLEENGLKGVFFVDPMPALLWGAGAVADVVGPIVSRGHDVQLHLHTEWLALAQGKGPVGSRTGVNIKDFAFADQCALLDWGRRMLVEAGAPQPIAFRAGNYGANDDTLHALAAIGMTHDSNHAPGIPDSPCEIELGQDDRSPLLRHAVTEVPIGCVGDPIQGLRHAQITALSQRELLAAVSHARAEGHAGFTIVSHSFEMLCRRREKINSIVTQRFGRFCRELAKMPGIDTGTYRDDPPVAAATPLGAKVLPPSYVLAGERIAEQVVGNMFYGQRRGLKRTAALLAASVAMSQVELA